MNITGLDKLKHKLKDMTEINDDVSFIMKMHSQEVVGVAIRNARTVMNKGYWTGNLARLIKADMNGKLSFTLTSNAFYSGFVEFGTRYMQAEPFIKPTIKTQGKQLQKDLIRLLKE